MPDESFEQDDIDDEGVLDPSDTLEGEPGGDPLEAGYLPTDRWSAGMRYGSTEAEERAGESLDQLLAEEEPDITLDPAQDEPDEAAGEGQDEAAGPDPRAGRLVAGDEGAHSDEEHDLVAYDAGIDGGAASAEEAAVHVTDDADSGMPSDD